jgi:molybdopterin-guanine dinucleotide biosynthesis protein
MPDSTTTSDEVGKHRSYNDRMATVIAEELDTIIERFDELEDFAVMEGYRALEHKISEARGPLSSAAEAMRQYATGEMRPE